MTGVRCLNISRPLSVAFPRCCSRTCDAVIRQKSSQSTSHWREITSSTSVICSLTHHLTTICRFKHIFDLFSPQINELSHVQIPIMLMPDDFKAYSKIKVDNHLFNKWALLWIYEQFMCYSATLRLDFVISHDWGSTGRTCRVISNSRSTALWCFGTSERGLASMTRTFW